MRFRDGNAARRWTGLLAAGVLSLSLSACLRPLYGPTPSGERLQDVLASIRVEPVISPPLVAPAERFGHYLRQELAYNLDGSGEPRPKRYRLTLTAVQSLSTPIVDSVAGRATSATLIESVNYALFNIETGRVVTAGTATGSASYDRFTQRFATVRAARDAEIRAAKLLAEQIKTRIAAAIATSS